MDGEGLLNDPCQGVQEGPFTRSSAMVVCVGLCVRVHTPVPPLHGSCNQQWQLTL